MQLEFVMYRTFTLGFQVGNCTHGSGVQVKDLCRQGSGPGNKFWTSEGHSQEEEAEKEWPVKVRRLWCPAKNQYNIVKF